MINCQLVGSHFVTIAVNNGVSKHASVCFGKCMSHLPLEVSVKVQIKNTYTIMLIYLEVERV